MLAFNGQFALVRAHKSPSEAVLGTIRACKRLDKELAAET